MVKSLFAWGIISGLVHNAGGQINSPFNAAYLQSVANLAKANLQSTSLGEIYDSLRILAALEIDDFKCHCPNFIDLVEGSRESIEIFFAWSVRNFCNCQYNLQPPSRESVVSKVESIKLDELSGAVLAANAFRQPVDFTAVYEHLKAFMEPDGRFKSNIYERDTATTANTFTALKVLGSFLHDVNTDQMTEVTEAAAKLLPTGEDDSIVDPIILSQLAKISPKKPRLTAARLEAIVDSLHSLRHSSSLSTIAAVLESLKFVTTYKAQPLFVQLSTSVLHVDDESKVVGIQLLDALGRDVGVEKLTVDGVRPMEPGRDRDAILFKGESNNSIVDLSSVLLDVGRHSIELTIDVTGRSKPLTIQKEFIVRRTLHIANVRAGVSASLKADRSALRAVKGAGAGAGGRLDVGAANASNGDLFHLHFSIASGSRGSSQRLTRPHQVFIKFTHSLSGSSTFVVAAPIADSAADALKYQAALSLAKESSRFMHQSGEYSVSIVVGDVAVAEPLDWLVGTVSMIFPSRAKKAFPLYKKSLLHDSDLTLLPLPEIAHQMRAPATRASADLSLLFTGLSVMLLVAFLVHVMALKPNMKLLFASSTSSQMFAICVTALSLLYVAYWLALEGFAFYDTVKYICILAPVTVGVGRAALISLSNLRSSVVKQY